MKKFITDTFYTKQQYLKILPQLIDFLNENNPTHYLCIRLPLFSETSDMYKALDILHPILLDLERILGGLHWNRHHLRFRGVVELGKTHVCHFHIHLTAPNHTLEQIQRACEIIMHLHKMPSRAIDVQNIDRTPENLAGYNSKEILTDNHQHFDSLRLFTSEQLFNIPYKRPKE